MFLKIFTGLLKKALGPLLGGPHFVVNGTKRVNKKKAVAHNNDPVITYFSTHKTKPKVKHTTIA